MSHTISRKWIVIFGFFFLASGCATKPGVPPITLEAELYAALGQTIPIDTNQDGEITKKEFTKRMEAIYQKELQRADLNEDDKLSRFELIYARTNAPGAIIWTGMDADKNGELTLDEFNRFVKSKVEEILRKYDSNKDGNISQKEFIGKNQRTLESLDTDKNGSINLRELAAAPPPPVPLMMDPETQLAPKICGPICVWVFDPFLVTHGESQPPICVRDPGHSVCPSPTHPGCTNGDVGSGNCVCPWPGYCEPFF